MKAAMKTPSTSSGLPASPQQRFAAARLRRTILDMAYAGSTVHIGCALCLVELLAVLYRSHLRYPGNDPAAPGRDYLVLSKGHGVMAQYACMLELGWLTSSQIENYFKDGTDLKGLSDSRIAGLEVTSGSLGHGFSVGVGIALGLTLLATDQKVYTIVGDGELNEGAIWEGVMVAAHYRLSNFLVIVDKNGFQAMGTTEEILAPGDLCAKFASFGFAVAEVDGHDEAALDAAIRELWADPQPRPKALVARTVKGKGIPFMESDNRWHYTRLDPATYRAAIEALTDTAGRT